MQVLNTDGAFAVPEPLARGDSVLPSWKRQRDTPAFGNYSLKHEQREVAIPRVARVFRVKNELMLADLCPIYDPPSLTASIGR
jgi:hypothetical protein